MRVALAGFLHETNTFAPDPADLAAFRAGGGYVPLSRGDAMLAAVEGVNLGIAGAVSAGRDHGWDIVPVLWAGAIPSARVTREAFETIAEEIVSGIRAAGPLDGVFLDLHGAMVTEHLDDGEAELARRVRAAVGSDVPVVAALDLHGNISEDFVAEVDGCAGFRTYPHVDMAETGRRAATLLERIMRGGMRPARAFRQMDYLVPIPFQSTDIAPADALYADLAAIEEADPQVRAASLFMGFPAADIPMCGPCAVVYADSQAAADRAADRIAAAYAAAEDRFDGTTYDAADAVREAAARAARLGRPVVIADTQDNPGAGGVAATTGLLRALVEADARDAAIGLLVDPATAARAHEVGQGSRATFRVGGHPHLPDETPVEIEAVVEALSDGRIIASGPYYGGTAMDLGPAACLRVGGVRIAVASRIAQTADREMFRMVGIAPEAQAILVVKSSTHFRADFAPIAGDILIGIAPGPMPFDPAALPFERLRPGLRLSPNGPAFGGPRAAMSARPGRGGPSASAQDHPNATQQGVTR
ncbi:M81 family metallopeptidase [Roseivivax isoporae]|uniref:MlrC domain-containing protein n=1 Tax=Roseivivax isoporae LMG 25204 TaxID=1449351 RepID=X7F721_9RHOB|nr:M81 family metallopeptidase [Roseivivax isoporae]ETX28575.1 MlrC domain-containing protein [Roseivivax isoporae LMG 25204]